MTAMVKDSTRRYLTFEAFIKACDEAIAELAEKTGSSIRLLRKPLVITKKTPKRPDSSRSDALAAPSADPKAALPAVTAPPPPGADAASDRIQRKHAERRQAESQRLATPPSSPAAGAAPAGATHELIKVQTDKIERKRKEVAIAVPGATPSKSTKPPAKSAVYAEDAQVSPGTGFIPWLILGGAVLVAAALVIYQVRAG